jgi:hypothetical protein
MFYLVENHSLNVRKRFQTSEEAFSYFFKVRDRHISFFLVDEAHIEQVLDIEIKPENCELDRLLNELKRKRFVNWKEERVIVRAIKNSDKEEGNFILSCLKDIIKEKYDNLSYLFRLVSLCVEINIDNKNLLA